MVMGWSVPPGWVAKPQKQYHRDAAGEFKEEIRSLFFEVWLCKIPFEKWAGEECAFFWHPGCFFGLRAAGFIDKLLFLYVL
jgi:hypothetical protein